MSKQAIARTALAVLVILYNFIFWGEKLGINLFLFTVLLYIALSIIESESFKRPIVNIFAGGTILLSAFVVYNGSVLSVWMYFLSLSASVGLIHQPQIKAIAFAFPTFALSYLTLPITIIEEMKFAFSRFKYARRAFKFVKLVVLPVIILIIFYVIYINANPIFAQASGEFWSYTDDAFKYLFENFPFTRGLFVTAGILLIMGIIYNRNVGLFTRFEEMFKDKLHRREPHHYQDGMLLRRPLFKITSLLNEYRISVILLVLVNALILILNYIDIRYYWFDFTYYDGFDIRQFVHEGTYLLILSILLSMAILLFFFRGKLNFYSKNNTMKLLAYLWILQNAIMAISVGVRNYYYIHYSHTLAFKRIGLIIFLLLTFIGLITLFFKIKDKKTFFNLFKVNSYVAYAVLLIASFFSWSEIIAEYNFTNPDKEKIDYGFMLNLNDAALPILDRNKHILDREVKTESGWIRVKVNGLEEYNRLKEQFLEDQKGYSFLSWNYNDNKVKEYFANNN